jgi:hypothetical protein
MFLIDRLTNCRLFRVISRVRGSEFGGRPLVFSFPRTPFRANFRIADHTAKTCLDPDVSRSGQASSHAPPGSGVAAIVYHIMGRD